MHKVDDGKTGPFNRDHHKMTEDGALVVDHRCGDCQFLIEGLLELEKGGNILFDGDMTVRTAAKTIAHARAVGVMETKAHGSYGVGL